MAAAACARGEAAPPELRRYWRIKQLGQRDWGAWRARDVLRLQVCANVYEAHRQYLTSTNGAEWANRNPDLFKLIVMAQKLNHNG